MRLDRDTEQNFRRRFKFLIEETLKVLLHPPPPSGKRKFIRLVELTIPKMAILSISKWDCENYLLRFITCNLV